MIDLYIGSTNTGKIREYNYLLSPVLDRFNLQPVAFDVDEPYDSLEENAQHKAIEYSKQINGLCFAEDSGLFVHNLNRLPGVYSARFYKAILSFDSNDNYQIIGFNNSLSSNGFNKKNIYRILSLLKDYTKLTDRRCHYATAIAVADKGNLLKTIQGKCSGYISLSPKGDNGFGYDPIFIPAWQKDINNLKTFAELKQLSLNIISARGNATDQLIEFLKTIV